MPSTSGHDRSIPKYYRIVALIVLLAIVSVSLILYFGRAQALTLLKDHYFEEQRIIARQSSLAINQKISYLVEEIVSLSLQKNIMRLDPEATPELLAERFNRLAKDYPLSDISRADDLGVIRFTVKSPALVGKDFSFREYYKKMKDEGMKSPAYEFITFKGAEKGRKGMLIAMPVFDEKGRFAGPLVFVIRVDELLNSISPLQDSDIKLWAIDEADNVLYHPKYPPGTVLSEIKGADPAFISFLEQAKSGDKEGAEYINPAGEKVLAIAHPIDIADHKWIIVVETPERIITGILTNLSAEYILAVIFAIIAILTSVLIVVRNMARWNRELIREIAERARLEADLKKSEKRYMALFDQASESIFVLKMDKEHGLIIVEANKAACDMHGYSKDELMGKPIATIDDPETASHIPGRARKLIMGEKVLFEGFHTKKDGTRFPIEVSAQMVDTGDEQYILAFDRDITERMRMQESILQAKQDWENTFNSISDIITIHDENFNIVRANKSAEDQLGLPFLEGRKIKCFKYFHDLEIPPKDCPSCVCLDSNSTNTTEVFEPHLNMFIEVRAIPRLDSAGRPTGIIHIVRDITERKTLEDELKHRALYDSLTKLPNRALFMDRLVNISARKLRHEDYLFAVLFLDMDRFKNINDSLGHSAGDELLRAVAGRLHGCIRPADTVARFGGDEFAIILDEISGEHDAIAIAERVNRSLEEPFNLGGKEVYINASIGIAVGGDPDATPEDLLRDADTAMYHAKSSGRACYVVFNENMHHMAVESLTLENDLRRATERDEFEIYYQPILDLTNGDVSSFEALVRWRHPERGMILPENFIPLAEETGLISLIGELVLRQACRDLLIWQAEFHMDTPLSVSVNLSAKQLNNGLPVLVADILSESGLNPASLKLEITESVIMENPDNASAILHKLKDMGVQVYIDDFGTGYSSLNYIHRFPVHALKIDRTFVNNMKTDKDSQEIIKAITTIAHNLGMNVIVEGVEMFDQLEYFRKLKCGFSQGYLFSEPLPNNEISEYMRKFQ